MTNEANKAEYPPLPDLDAVEQHIYGACRRYVTQDMLEPIYNLMRDYVDADRAMRAQLSYEAIEKIAVKHEAFGFGRVDARGLTTHGFDPVGLIAFVKEVLAAAPQPAPRELLSADDLREPKNGTNWRVEWWNESARLMLPANKRLDSFQSYSNGTLMFTLKEHGTQPAHKEQA